MFKFVFLLFTSFLFSEGLIYKQVRIYNPDTETISTIQSLGIPLDHIYKVEGQFIEFAVSDHYANLLSVNNVEFDIIHDDLQKFYESRLYNISSRDFDYGSMGGYYTYNEIVEHINELSSEYSDIVSEVQVIGESLEGRPILAIKLSDNPNINENEPEVLYTGLHHAREPMSYMNLFYYMYWLVENYTTDDLAASIINNRELWFIPCINPDGLVYNQQIAPNGGGMQRKNHRETCTNNDDFSNWDGIDLNRNYSFQWGYDNSGSSGDGCNQTYRGTNSFSEPETQAVRDFVSNHNFKAALNYHSYGNLLIHPFGYEPGLLPPDSDLTIFREFGDEMTKYNNYLMGTGIETVGYTVNGEACDWMYGSEGIFAYTPEVGNSGDGFWPSSDRILPLAEENLYPNQFLSIASGSKYDVDFIIDSDTFSYGNDYSISVLLSNSGLSDSNGPVIIELISSDNITCDQCQIFIDGVDSRSTLQLDDIFNFQVSVSADLGIIEQIIINVYDSDEIVYSDEAEILLGESTMLIFEDFESETQWEVGFFDDDATAGIWERAIPNATSYEGVDVQPGFDNTEDGSFCYVTGNAVANNQVGFDDVDGGKTTLISPVFDLSDFSSVIISYWRWYTNNVGDNPNNDAWEVSVSNDGGNTWSLIERTTQTNNSWIYMQFLIDSAIVELNDQIQFRFIAEDIYYNGDNGTGGSIVEAAIDDFSISYFEENFLLGDSNNDGVLNILDVINLINLILYPDGLNNETVDMNSDSELDVLDVILLVNLILGA